MAKISMELIYKTWLFDKALYGFHSHILSTDATVTQIKQGLILS